MYLILYMSSFYKQDLMYIDCESMRKIGENCLWLFLKDVKEYTTEKFMKIVLLDQCF